MVPLNTSSSSIPVASSNPESQYTRGLNYEETVIEGVHYWNSAPLYIQEGGNIVPYVYENKTTHLVVKSALITAEFYPKFTRFYDPAYTEVRLQKEEWIVERLSTNEKWLTVSEGQLVSTVVTETNDSIMVTKTFSHPKFGVLVIDYLFRAGLPLKHTVTFTSSYDSTETFRVVQRWTGIKADKVKHSGDVAETETSINSETVITDYRFSFIDSSGVTIIEDQSAMVYDTGLVKKNTERFISGTLNTDGNAKKADFVFGNWVLATGESLIIDPYTATLNNPTEDGIVVDTFVRYETEVVTQWGRTASLLTWRSYFEWDISSIFDGATITDTVFKYQGVYAGVKPAKIYELSVQPTVASNTALYNGIGADTAYVTGWNPTVATNQQIDLTATADTDLQNSLVNNWFAIAIKSDDETTEYASTNVGRTATEEAVSPTPVPTLYVVYTAVVPFNDACVSSGQFFEGANGWVNVTVSDPDLVADLNTVDIQVNTTGDAESFTLRWTQSSGVFSEVSDTSNVCTLGSSIRTNVNTDTDTISFQFSLSGGTVGFCDIKVTTTDDSANTDIDTYNLQSLYTTSSWADTDYTKCKLIKITENSASALTNYQVSLTVVYDANMQADFDDLRFYWWNQISDTQVACDYWIESKTDSVTATVWVEVPSIASSGNEALLMYYGFVSATAGSNIVNTFVFADDFSSTLDTVKWDAVTANSGVATVTGGSLQFTSNNPSGVSGANVASDNAISSGNYILESYVKRVTGAKVGEWGLLISFTDKTTLDSASYGVYTARNARGTIYENVADRLGVGYDSSFVKGSNSIEDAWDNVWMRMTSTYLHTPKTMQTRFVYGTEDVTLTSGTGTTQLSSLYIHLGYGDYQQTNAYAYVDWVAVRNYASTEPTSTFYTEDSAPANQAPSNGAATISNMDDTNNLYAQKGLYTSTVIYTDTDGFADFTYVEFRVKQGATTRAAFRYNQDTTTFSTPTGSTEWTLDGTSGAVESANTITVTWQFTPQWDATEESAVEIELYCIDAASASDTDTAQTDYADVVTNLVTAFNLDDARGDISQSVTASGNVYYANNPASTTATTFYPPNAEFTGVSVYNVANTNMGTDTTIVNGAWSQAFTAPATVGTDTYNAYIAMADADYTDAEETPSAAFITDQLEITSTAASAARVGVSTAFELRCVIKYSYDSVAFTGSTGSITGYVYDSVNSWWDKAETAAATVTSTTYDETSITATDSTYGITSKKDVAGVAVISDQIRVTDLGVLPNAAPSLGSSVTFYATADLQYDSHAVGLGDTLILGGYTFTWTPENSRWELSHTEGDTATVTINTFTSGNEATYGVTAGSINSKTVSASWGTTPPVAGGGGGGGGGRGAPPPATIEVTGETTQTTDQVPIIPLYPQAPPDLMGAGLIGLIALVSVPFLLSWKNGGKKTVTQQFEKRLRDNQKTLLNLKMPDYESFWKKKS